MMIVLGTVASSVAPEKDNFPDTDKASSYRAETVVFFFFDYFSHCCDQMPKQSSLWKGAFILVLTLSGSWLWWPRHGTRVDQRKAIRNHQAINIKAHSPKIPFFQGSSISQRFYP